MPSDPAQYHQVLAVNHTCHDRDDIESSLGPVSLDKIRRQDRGPVASLHPHIETRNWTRRGPGRIALQIPGEPGRTSLPGGPIATC